MQITAQLENESILCCKCSDVEPNHRDHHNKPWQHLWSVLNLLKLQAEGLFNDMMYIVHVNKENLLKGQRKSNCFEINSPRKRLPASVSFYVLRQ